MRKILLLLSSTILIISSAVGQKQNWQADNFTARNIATTKQFDFSFSKATKHLTDNTALSSLTLPNPKGVAVTFALQPLQVMSDGLAKKYPMIKTYQGVSENGEEARFSISPSGIHAMVFSKEGLYFIDPIELNTNTKYQAYYKHNLALDAEKATFQEGEPIIFDKEKYNRIKQQIENGERSLPPTGPELRTYRIAIATTGEYSAFHGGTIQNTLAAIVTTMTRVNGIFEKELAIRMVLVANNDELIFLNENTDPFTNSDASAYIDEVQTFLDNTVGVSNYDIGHGFSTGAGGLAGLGVVCRNGNKGSGVTGTNSPIGDPYDVDYVAHEIGHQFGAPHTFNGTVSSCQGNGGNATAYEPGSGVTIMAYAGICGSDNIANNSIPYFHASSLQSISAYSQEASGNTCAAISNTGNSFPEVEAGQGGFTIPISTPFQLNGAATDADGDQLSYSWEQFDLGPRGAPNNPTGNAPLFRSFIPTADSFRIFPQISDILNETETLGEVLPAYARDLSFILTVRDNQAVGGVNNDLISFSVSDVGGPFTVENIQGNFNGLETFQVNWNVANTDQSPINCSTVDIYLSDDGGFTFDYLLAEKTPNDGSQIISLPNINATNVKIKVAASENIFFNITPGTIAISESSDPSFTLTTSFDQSSYCPSDNITVNITSSSLFNFSEPITLSTNNLASGLTASFNPSTINPGENAVLTLTNSGALSGEFNFTIVGTTASLVKDVVNDFIIANDPETPQIISPAGTEPTSLFPIIEWSDNNLSASYNLTVASDADFQNIIETVNDISATSYQLTEQLIGATTYFLRLNASNSCGTSPDAELTFQTDQIVCLEYIAENVPIEIPSSISSITSELQIIDEGTIESIEVLNVNGTHSFVSDLTFTLESPSGTQVKLLSEVCGSENDFNFSFSDLSGINQTEITCPPTNGTTFIPSEPLSALNGEEINGKWKLIVFDAFQEDGGSLAEWELSFCLSNAKVAPAIPTEFMVTYIDGLDIELNWNDVESETAYEVEVKASANSEFIALATLEADVTSYTTSLQDVNTTNTYRLRAVNDGSFSKYSDELDASIALLGNTNQKWNQLKIYPNPVKNIVYIQSENAPKIDRILVYNSSGQLLMNQSEELNKIDVSALKSGLYLIRFISNNDQFLKRIVVE